MQESVHSLFQGVHSFLINKKQKKKAHILANPLSLLRQTKKTKQKITAIHMLIYFIEKKKKKRTHTQMSIYHQMKIMWMNT